MWFSSKRSSERRRRAALVVLLGVVSFKRLNDTQQEAVLLEVKRMLAPFGIAYAWHESGASVVTTAVFRAVAMHRLGFPSGSPSASWASLLYRGWALLPASIGLTFRRFAPETELAREHLRSEGFVVPADCPSQMGEDAAAFSRRLNDT